MTGESVDRLFDEFAAAYARGERPAVATALERAGDEADELARMLDAFLTAAPPRATVEDDVVLMRARIRAEPPLLALRLQRRLTRDAVVDALMGALGLDPGKRAKVRGYFADLEVGVLDPRGVAPVVWDALGKVLGADALGTTLLTARGVSLSAKSAFYRVADKPELAQPVAAAPVPGTDATEWDEVDRLFTSNG